MTLYRSRTQTVLRPSRSVVAATAAAVIALGLSACGGESANTASDKKPDPAATQSAALAAPVAMVDSWVKTAESGMTAIFGTLRNDTDAEITVISAASAISPMELHEVAMNGDKMAMRLKEGGFVIPARGSHELKPGGDHLMLVGLTQPVKAGDEVAVTLTLKDGKTMRFTAVAKPFAGGNENYEPGMGGMTPTPATHG